MPHDSQWENPPLKTLFQNGACAKWSNFFIFKYKHIIYHFLAFFMLNNFLYLSSENVRISCYLTKWPTFQRNFKENFKRRGQFSYLSRTK